MNKKEFYVLNNLFDSSMGRQKNSYEVYLNENADSREVLEKLVDEELINSENYELTQKGLDALKPYKVDNAVILAAGAATRFIPLSLEQPKGLYEVKGERLI